jgi:hypothetical protein
VGDFFSGLCPLRQMILRSLEDWEALENVGSLMQIRELDEEDGMRLNQSHLYGMKQVR